MIEILLSTYNGETYLAEQLESLLAQTYADFRVSIRDDGSRDRTIEIARSYAARYPERIAVQTGKNLGAPGSFFALLKNAGDVDYYAFCDQDDVWAPDKLERAVKALDSLVGEPALYASGLELVSSSLQHMADSRPPTELSFRSALVESLLTGCTMVMNRRARDLLVAHDPGGAAQMHDWWCYLVISALGRIVYEPRPSLKYRQHGGNVVGMPISFWGRWRRRFSSLSKGKRPAPWPVQALTFARLYRDQLAPEQRVVLDMIERSEAHWLARLRLALSCQIRRQSALDGIILRLMILLGKYS